MERNILNINLCLPNYNSKYEYHISEQCATSELGSNQRFYYVDLQATLARSRRVWQSHLYESVAGSNLGDWSCKYKGTYLICFMQWKFWLEI